MNRCDYLIIGGGPTGIGAALRLQERGAYWHLIEAEDHFGGLSASFRDEQGFTWDLGGHVQFSHYETFDRFMDEALGANGWLPHERESWVWIRRRFVPYPFQNNLHRLDPEDRWACVEGLLEAHQRAAAGGSPSARPSNFEEWMLATLGRGITEIFMHPYNFKVWAYPPHTLAWGWIGERVSVPPLGSVLKSICMNRDEVSWGPNKLFKFPKSGGTGAVWSALGGKLKPERVALGDAVEAIDAVKQTVRTKSGRQFAYRHLISTMPLNHLIRCAPGVADAKLANDLIYSATHVVGVGVNGSPPAHLKTKCWMYFPENNSPYYRATVFSNYSPNNCARPGAQWSLMAETSESPAKPVDKGGLVEEALLALEEDGLIPDRNAIVSVVSRRIPMGYPTPFIGRDSLVDPVLRAFEKKNIWSRGRFGAWKYEVANQDHSFAQGYECAERLLNGGGPEYEPTLHEPELVNGRRNP